MEIITRNLPKPIKPEKGNEEPLARYSDEQKEAIYLWRSIPKYQHDVLVHDVLAVIGERHKLKLTLKEIGGTVPLSDGIVATDDKGTTYFLVGSWWDCRFVCRGLLKRRKGVNRASYLINGQSCKGTIQVEHYGEQLQIRYPEIQEIYNKIPWMKKP